MRTDKLARFILLPDLVLVYVIHHGRSANTLVCVTRRHPQACQRCAALCSSTYDHRVVHIKDETLRGKSIRLRIRKRRLWCKECRLPFMEYIGGIAKRSRTTQRYKAAILWAAENFTDLERVRRAYRCSDGYLYGALYEMLELKRKQRLYPWPKRIGIDEHSFRRWKKKKIGWATGIIDIKNTRLFEMVDGKSGDDLTAALKDIPGRDNVRFAVIDLSEGFRAYIKGFFRKAEIVADKFHVIRLFSKALNRRRLDVTGIDRKTPLRSLLLRNAEELEAHEAKVLAFWLGQHPDVRELYELKEAVRRFYRIKGYRRANRALTKLTDRMDKSSLEAVRALRATLIDWRTEVMAYFKTGLTNAMAEGFNNKLKLVQRKAYGLRSFAHYRLRALNACA